MPNRHRHRALREMTWHQYSAFTLDAERTLVVFQRADKRRWRIEERVLGNTASKPREFRSYGEVETWVEGLQEEARRVRERTPERVRANAAIYHAIFGGDEP